MANHDIPTRVAIATLVLAGLDLGSIHANARIIVYTAANAVLAIYDMGQPAFPVPSSDLTASNVISQAINQNSGVPHHFEVTDRNGAARLFGTIGVAGSGADLEAQADPILPTQPLSFTAGQPS